MDRQQTILAALAGIEDGSFTPVQVQKIFFLIDRNLPASIGGQKFNFQPYDYGPFDPDVYRELETLERQGLVRIDQLIGGGKRVYSLTPNGYKVGVEILGGLQPQVSQYIRELTSWIVSQSFSTLVGTIYRLYPDMKVNSVFKY